MYSLNMPETLRLERMKYPGYASWLTVVAITVLALQVACNVVNFVVKNWRYCQQLHMSDCFDHF